MRTLSGRVLQTTRPAGLASKLVVLAITDVLRAGRVYALIRLLRFRLFSFLTVQLTGSRACMAKTILNFLGKSLGKILDGLPARLLPLPHISRGNNRRQESGHKMIGKEM
jgi:hypothetical protein